MRSIAFYLPQFHPIPENDEWWGAGFTEWVNVAGARPLFRGHHQPRLPADLGFYDLRLAETRAAQARLATDYGIDAFCYYHYWFNGRRLLHRPLDDVLNAGEPSLPFALCWANENWTRVWDGGHRDVLVAQRYGEDDDVAHARWLATCFADSRYLHVDGRPLFLVYRASLLPDAKRTTDLWREHVTRAGLPEPFLCRVESFPDETGDPRLLGFDAAVEFAPEYRSLPRGFRTNRVFRAMARQRLLPAGLGHHRIDYGAAATAMMRKPPVDYPRYRTVAPGWDNTPRRTTGGLVLTGSTPELYEEWVRFAVRSAHPPTPDQDLLFVNAWNEWAEGAYLEPDRRWGHAFLEAHQRGVAGGLAVRAGRQPA